VRHAAQRPAPKTSRVFLPGRRSNKRRRSLGGTNGLTRNYHRRRANLGTTGGRSCSVGNCILPASTRRSRQLLAGRGFQMGAQVLPGGSF
jgi:hypothetical protein